MSQYIHFFVRSTDRLLPIRTISRSSSIYSFFSKYAPYEKARALSGHELRNICEEIYRQIDEGARDSIRETKEFVNEMTEALTFAYFLMDMYNEADDTKYEDETARLDPTKYLYFGIECGTPSIAEIEEWENFID